MSILSRSCVDFVRSAQAEIVCRFRQVIYWSSLEFGSNLEIFTEVENCRERGDESLMKLVEFNLDSNFVSEKESDPIGVS